MAFKPLRFMGDSKSRLQEMRAALRKEAGYQLLKVQEGDMPEDFKPMPGVGAGAYEIRIYDDQGIAAFSSS